MPWFKSLPAVQKMPIEMPSAQEMQGNAWLLSIRSQASSAINAQTIRRLQVGMGLFSEGKSRAKEKIPWKLIRAQLEVRNKEPKMLLCSLTHPTQMMTGPICEPVSWIRHSLHPTHMAICVEHHLEGTWHWLLLNWVVCLPTSPTGFMSAFLG